jgi:hypothetical protein
MLFLGAPATDSDAALRGFRLSISRLSFIRCCSKPFLDKKKSPAGSIGNRLPLASSLAAVENPRGVAMAGTVVAERRS